MKATMSADGVVTLSAESSVEAYALRTWAEDSLIARRIDGHAEDCFWCGSRLIVDANEPVEVAQ